MTNLELKTWLVNISHRSDLGPVLQQFVADATALISLRFNLTLAPLVADTDTDPVLDRHPLIYQYAAARALYEFTNNGENATYYGDRWNALADAVNVTNPDNVELQPAEWATEPPVISRSI